MELSGRETLVTQAGFDALEAELEHLTKVKRQEVAERIKNARDDGDITENAEYDAAKDEQARVEARIIVVEEKIRTAKVIAEVDTKSVGIGNKVTVQEKGAKEPEVFTIVGSTEADPLENRISNESPMGSALMGQAKGAKIVVPAPRGEMTFEIIKIAK